MNSSAASGLRLPALKTDPEASRLQKKKDNTNLKVVAAQTPKSGETGIYDPSRRSICCKSICTKGKCAVIGVFLGAAAAAAIVLYSRVLTPCHQVTIQAHIALKPFFDVLMDAVDDTTLRLSDGNCIEATTCYTGSERESDPCNNGRVPHLWVPPNVSWLKRDEAALRAEGQEPFVKDLSSCVSVAKIPIGLAVTRDVATGLGWPTADIGFEDIANLISNGLGEVADVNVVGERFAMVSGSLETSNAAQQFWAEAVIGWNGLNASDELTGTILDSIATTTQSTLLSSAVEHQDKFNSDVFNEKLVPNLPKYVHAAPAYESEVFVANQGPLTSPIVLLYPKSGVIVQDFPMCVLNGDNKKDIGDTEIEGAQIVAEFLLRERQQIRAPKTGIRPGTLSVQDVSGYADTFQTTNGLIPDYNAPDIAPPSDISALDQLVSMWKVNKKPVVWSIVIDSSGSILERRDDIADAVESFVNKLQDHDTINLSFFRDEVTEALYNATVADVKNSVRTVVEDHVFGGNNALYTALDVAADGLSAIRDEDIASGVRRSYGILVLNDGPNDRGIVTAGDIRSKMAFQDSDATQYHLFAVNYGSGDDSAEKTLGQLASFTKGDVVQVAKENTLLQRAFEELVAKL